MIAWSTKYKINNMHKQASCSMQEANTSHGLVPDKYMPLATKTPYMQRISGIIISLVIYRV